MSASMTRSETLDERVDRLVCAHGDAWPPLHSTTTHGAIGELIARVEGLEEAIHLMAREIERLEADLDVHATRD